MLWAYWLSTLSKYPKHDESDISHSLGGFYDDLEYQSTPLIIMNEISEFIVLCIFIAEHGDFD